MKRHISIFALLLSAFVAGVARQAVADEVVVISDRSDLSVTDISFRYDSQSRYYWGRNTLPSDLTLSSVPSGYRFRGWYTMAGNDDTREGEGTSPTKCTRLLTDGQTITAAKISEAATSAYWSERGTGYVVCPQFVKTYRISTAVSPAGAGSVSGGGTVDDGGSVTLEAKANTGYVFSQWSDGSTTNPRTISDIKADATYTAEFARQTFDLTLGVMEGVARIGYRTGSGGGFTYVTEDTVIKADYGSSYDLIAEASGGWSFDGAPTKQETFSNITSAKVFNPAPERATYTVTVEPNGGSGGSCPSYTVSTSQQTKTITLPTRTGYSIASSWDVSGAMGKTPTVAGNTLTIPAGTYGNLTLTPTWTVNEYSLTVNPNGGSYEGQAIEQKLQEKLRYDATNLNAISVATRENYTLSGYYTSSSGGTKVYDGNGHNVKCDFWTAAYPSGTFKGTSDLRVYAIWTPNASTVSLDKQGGTGGANTVSVKYDTTVPAITSLPTRKGYSFEGYYTGKNGGGRKYYNANGEGLEKWTSAGTTTLYANWTPNGYKVQYELNGGSTGTDAPQSAKVGTAFRVSTPTRAGYTFTGWNVTGTSADYTTAKWGIASDSASTAIPNASTVCFNSQYSFVYFLNLTMTQDATVTLKANWKANTYEVAVSPNGGSGGSCESYTVSTSQQTKTVTLPTRGGYSISKWTVSGASGGTPTVSGTTLTIPAGTYGKLTLTPTWTANSYEVVVDANGGSGGSCPSYTVSTSQQTKTIILPTKGGYSVSKWTVSGASGGTPTASGTALTIPAGTYGKLTLTPTWTAVSYAITYSGLKTGSTHNNPTSYTIESATIAFSSASDVSDYKFLEWSPASIPSGSTGNKTVTATYLTKIQKPSVTAQLTYNGSSQSCASSGLNNMQVSGNTATVPGSYTATFTPNSGYCWSDDGSTSAHSVGWKIVNAEISNVSAGQSGSLTYNGKAQAPEVNANATTKGSQTAIWKYSKTAGGYAAQVPTFTDAGTYTVYYEVSAQYHNPKTGSFSVTIGPSKTATVTLSKTQFGYTGKEQGPTVTCVNCAEVSSSVKTGTEVGTYYVKAAPSKNYAWSDGSTESKSFAWQIVEGSFKATIASGEGGESGTGSTVSYTTSPDAQTKQISQPKRKGYEIDKWSASGYTGTAPTISGTTLTIPAHTAGAFTMTPTWKAKRYTLTIALKEGESYGVYKGPQNYQLSDPLIFGETNLNEIAVAYKKDDADFQGYFTSAGAMVYDAQGRNVMGALGEYWTNNYPVGTYCYDGNLTLSARFADPREHYEVTVTASPAEAGTVDPSGTGTYVEGSNIVLTAAANTGYSFWHWTKNGAEVSTAKEYPLTVSARAEYVAVFTGNVYTVTFIGMGGLPAVLPVDVKVGEKWETFFPSVTYPGQRLVDWYSNVTYAESSRIDGKAKVPGTPPLALYAKWEEVPPVVTFADPEGGHESIQEPRTKGQPISEPAKGTENWKRDGYWRDNWSDWDKPLSTVVTGDMTVNAKWTSIADVLDCTNLLFNVDSGTTNWVVCTDDHVVGNSCMKLVFSEGRDHLSTQIPGAGTLSFNWRAENGVLCVSTNNQYAWISQGQESKWTAANQESITIAGPCDLTFYSQSSGPVSIKVDNVTWTTGIVPQKHRVSISAGEHGTAAMSPVKDEYDVGDTVTLTATADTGYAFCCWTNDTGFATNANPWTFKVVDDVAYTATFTNCQYVVTLDPNGGTGGETSVLVTYDTDLPKIDVLPHKDDGSSFLGYFDQKTNGTQYYSNEGTGLRKWDKPNAATLYAQWKAPDMFTLTVTDDGHGTATKEPNQSQYASGTKVTLTATANEGYAFEKWSDGSIEIIREVTVMSNASYAASFTNIPVVVIDPIARALDCEDSGLTFEVTGGWSVFTNQQFADEGISCLTNTKSGALLSTTISQSGTLTFYWKAPKPSSGNPEFIRVQTNDQTAISCKLGKDDKEQWKPETFSIDATQGAVELTFRSTYNGGGSYTALDHFTWTPEGKEPEYADTDTPVTGFSMADGKLGFSFVGDGSTYHLLGTNDLIAPMPWPMVFETNKASGTILFDIPVKADEPKMFYRIRALE